MTVTSKDIKLLRDKTGAGILDCKKALDETTGNIEKAIEWLRKKGINTAEKKSSRDALDGLITVDFNNNGGVVVEINAETDFVARNENFQKFCADISSLCLKKQINNLDDLLSESYLGNEKSVKDELANVISKLGENIVIKRFELINNQNCFYQKYLHNSVNENSGKIGVLLAYTSKENNNVVKEFSKNIAMHIAATEPKSIDIEKLDKKIVEKEKAIYEEQLKSSGKPQDIIEKIISGKINKFFEQVCLMEQFFVMDEKNKIKNCIKDFNNANNLNFELCSYCLLKLGQE